MHLLPYCAQTRFLPYLKRIIFDLKFLIKLILRGHVSEARNCFNNQPCRLLTTFSKKDEEKDFAIFLTQDYGVAISNFVDEEVSSLLFLEASELSACDTVCREL